MDTNIQLNLSIEQRQKYRNRSEKKPQPKDRTIEKSLFTLGRKEAINKSSENNLGRIKMEKAKFF